VEECNRAIKQGLRNGAIYNIKAISLAQLQQYDEAMKAINVAIKLAPGNAKFIKNKRIIEVKMRKAKHSQTSIQNAPIKNKPKSIQTPDQNPKAGQNKCPRCGSTDILLNANSGRLRCNFCKNEFESEKTNEQLTDIHDLEGKKIESGVSDIIADAKKILTFKCSSCGAEIVINVNETVQARCHWCRNFLSINQPIPNGSIPDMVLPFKITKSQAQKEIKAFVGQRRFFANPKFMKEFCTENIMGVYLPYMVVDISAHANLIGQGERLVRTRPGRGEVRYDADLYAVEREFDIAIDDLTIESSSDKLQHGAADKTTNIINAIKPFDAENCVKWDANFLRGYTSEKRDSNISQLQGFVHTKAKDIARHKANEVLKEYDRGVRWSNEQLDVKGTHWKTAYFPIWLYSYQQVVKKQEKVLHYVAVNARTKETMGSVPINMPKLILASILVSASILVGMSGVSFALVSLISGEPFLLDVVYALITDNFDLIQVFDTGELSLFDVVYALVAFAVFFFSGIGIFYHHFYTQYRNRGARHMHETETKASISNVRKVDKLLRRLKLLSDSRMKGANNLRVDYGTADNPFDITEIYYTALEDRRDYSRSEPSKIWFYMKLAIHYSPIIFFVVAVILLAFIISHYE
jgi:DNA-directed RNA polymerase subunit RPC12/RpoP